MRGEEIGWHARPRGDGAEEVEKDEEADGSEGALELGGGRVEALFPIFREGPKNERFSM